MISKESFDAALLPGVRTRLADAYRSLRQSEHEVIQSVLDASGAFLDGMTHVRDCPLCQSSARNAVPVYHVHGMHIVRCGGCGLVYSREVLNAEADSMRYRRSRAMEAHIALRAHAAYAELETAKARYIVERISAVVHAEAPWLLDIGSSTGSILQAAAEAGWRAVGIELNHDAVGVARARGLETVEGNFPGDLPVDAGPFTAITLLDVLEHAEDPVGLLRSVAARLSPGGIVGIQVPNFDSLLIRVEGERNNNICHGHWSYFTSETLTKAAGRAGFTVVTMETIISEIDRILAHPIDKVVATAERLTGKRVQGGEITQTWLHEHLLGYKLLGIFSKNQSQAGASPQS